MWTKGRVLVEVEVRYRNNRFDIINNDISGLPLVDKIWAEVWEVSEKNVESDVQKIIDDWNKDPEESPRIMKIIRARKRVGNNGWKDIEVIK